MAYVPQDGCVVELMDPEHADNFWYEGRRKILQTSFERILQIFSPVVDTYLDYGAGTGDFAAWSRRVLGTADVVVADSSPQMLRIASERGLNTAPVPLSAAVRNLDLVTMFDVLEHIDNDVEFLAELHARMTPRGLLMISVPAHQWLFGAHDKRVGHYRRYSLKALKSAVEQAGFTVVWRSWYNLFLFPAMVLVRLKDRNKEEQLTRLPRSMNSLLCTIFGAERGLVKHRLLPYGASIIMVVRA